MGKREREEKTMVAISLYKGNLHKVPDVPRRWPPPTPKISLKEFKMLIRRRDMALSRLRSAFRDDDTDVATTSNPRPNRSVTDRDDMIDNDGDNRVDHQPQVDLKEADGEKEGAMRDGKLGELMEKSDALMGDEKPEVTVNEKNNTENDSGDAEKRKKEVKEKLVILNEKKHSLVQVLKQILSAEEHLKRQNDVQGTPGCPPLQVDTNTDSGSMSKANTPRVGPDGNPCRDGEGGEGDDASNHNFSFRSLPRMSSTSPSSDSQQRKPPASSMVPHSYRTSLGAAAGSPSRFAPAGQGQHSSVTVTVSGTSYITSSPSPAASGGTSVFRDGRLLSP